MKVLLINILFIRAISKDTNSDYGVGVTGKINDPDPNNNMGDNSTIFISIYNKNNNKYFDKEIKALNQSRIDNKELIKNEFIDLFKSII